MTVTPLTSPGTNQQHPVDRMAEIKAEIAQLESEYADLRALLLSGEVTLNGRHWIAAIVETTRRQISVRTAEKVLKPALFASLVKETRQIAVYLKKLAISNDGR